MVKNRRFRVPRPSPRWRLFAPSCGPPAQRVRPASRRSTWSPCWSAPASTFPSSDGSRTRTGFCSRWATTTSPRRPSSSRRRPANERTSTGLQLNFGGSAQLSDNALGFAYIKDGWVWNQPLDPPGPAAEDRQARPLARQGLRRPQGLLLRRGRAGPIYFTQRPKRPEPPKTGPDEPTAVDFDPDADAASSARDLPPRRRDRARRSRSAPWTPTCASLAWDASAPSSTSWRCAPGATTSGRSGPRSWRSTRRRGGRATSSAPRAATRA